MPRVGNYKDAIVIDVTNAATDLEANRVALRDVVERDEASNLDPVLSTLYLECPMNSNC